MTTISKEFQYLLHLTASASCGFSPEPPSCDLDWNRMAQLAREQSVEPLFACALKKAPEVPCPEELRNILIGKMFRSAMFDIRRRCLVVELLQEMEAEGIHVVVLKGFSVARYYVSPECRVSADTDLWVSPENEERACEFLRNKGFDIEFRWKNGHHAVCHHSEMGCVELHVILYDEIVEEIWFGNMDGREFIQEPHRLVQSQDGPYYCLGNTDNLIFLSLHMIKHFILSGMSVRMILDIALFLSKNAEEIDVDRFWNTMKQLRYERLMDAVLWAAVRFLGFDAAAFSGLSSEYTEETEKILVDLETGGWMGFNDKKAREDSWHEYNRQVMLRNMKPVQYKLYMLHWRLGGISGNLFPPRDRLLKKYPCLDNNAYLLPFVWVHRLAIKGYRAVFKSSLTQQIVDNEDNLTQIGKDRVAMFRELGML